MLFTPFNCILLLRTSRYLFFNLVSQFPLGTCYQCRAVEYVHDFECLIHSHKLKILAAHCLYYLHRQCQIVPNWFMPTVLAKAQHFSTHLCSSSIGLPLLWKFRNLKLSIQADVNLLLWWIICVCISVIVVHDFKTKQNSQILV